MEHHLAQAVAFAIAGSVVTGAVTSWITIYVVKERVANLSGWIQRLQSEVDHLRRYLMTNK